MTKRFKQLFFTCLVLGLAGICFPVRAEGHKNDGSLYGGASDKWHHWNDDRNGKNGDKSPGSDDSGTSLPINDNVIFLVLVATAIGCKIIIDKIKSAKQ